MPPLAWWHVLLNMEGHVAWSGMLHGVACCIMECCMVAHGGMLSCPNWFWHYIGKHMEFNRNCAEAWCCNAWGLEGPVPMQAGPEVSV